MFIINKFDVTYGCLAGQTITTNLMEKTWTGALRRVYVRVNGQSMEEPERYVTYILDDSVPLAQRDKLAHLFRKYQSEDDTREFGLEYDLFHDIYLTPAERELIHHDSVRWKQNNMEQKLQDRLKQEGKDVLAHKVHAFRATHTDADIEVA
jgi:hypothetical protein